MIFFKIFLRIFQEYFPKSNHLSGQQWLLIEWLHPNAWNKKKNDIFLFDFVYNHCKEFVY